MAGKCDLTGKRRLVGNNVSHAHNKTKMIQNVNLQTKKILNPATGEKIKLRLSASAIRTLDKLGSIEKFIKKFGHLYATRD